MDGSSVSSVSAQRGADTLATVTVRVLSGVDEVDVDACGAAAADATEAVASETAVCDSVFVAEYGTKAIRHVPVAVPA
uniref:hypothetical protein n=1 Tax=Halorubrum tropicale TaxID=1765655 RepID=UPI0006B20FC9|nr:hypothetical protein [Halorubrum tropicale]